MENQYNHQVVSSIQLQGMEQAQKMFRFNLRKRKKYWNWFTVFKPNWLPIETIKCNTTCGRYINAMKKTSTTLINLRDNLLEIEEDFKHTTMRLTKDNNRNMNKLTSLFYRFYVENITKIKDYRSKKVAVTKISENERSLARP